MRAVASMARRDCFMGNPWGLTSREARAVWMLQAFRITEIGERLGLATATMNATMQRAYLKMGVGHTAAAAVEFDRWWQVTKRNADDATLHLFEDELLKGAV